MGCQCSMLANKVKPRRDEMSKATSTNSGQKLEKLKMAGVTKSHNQQRIYGEIEEIEVEAETNFYNFNNFDVVESPPLDHNFLCVKNMAKLSDCQNKTLKKKISEEWEILNAELPRSIFYIRAYKTRFDLMRIVIIDDKATTSYHHGLFFFDLRFPKSYPSKPPKLYHQLHPNFHQGGNVSKDLMKKYWCELNRANREPSILKVLVLIQQLVSSLSPTCDLNRPTINFDKNNMIQSSDAILHMLKFPPKGFEVFVKGYFLLRAHYILLNYKVFMNPPDDKDLNRLFFKLVRAFQMNGTYCKHHYNEQEYKKALLEENKDA